MGEKAQPQEMGQAHPELEGSRRRDCLHHAEYYHGAVISSHPQGMPSFQDLWRMSEAWIAANPIHMIIQTAAM